MNLIDQVLSGLKKRGASALPGEPAMGVVQQVQKNRLGMVWIIAAALIVVFVLAGWWWSSRHKVAAPVAEVSQPGGGTPSPVAGDKAAQAPIKPITVPQAASQPVAIATQDEHKNENRQGADVPKTEPSRESSAAPPLPNLHVKPVATVAGLNYSYTASSHASTVKNKKLATASALVPVPEDSVDKRADVQQEKTAAENKVKLPAPDMVPVQEGAVDKRVRQISVWQQAENELRRASGLMQQGRTDEALAGYAAALQLDAGHDTARQAMIGLLLENKRNNDAERVLEDGLKLNPKHSGFAMLLARLQVDRGVPWTALVTLQKTLPYADQQADYRAFIAALLQRLDRHKEAIRHYQVALQLSPNSGVWLMGLGISLRAERRNEEARDVFRRAIESKTLSAELQLYVQQQMKEL